VVKAEEPQQEKQCRQPPGGDRRLEQRQIGDPLPEQNGVIEHHKSNKSRSSDDGQHTLWLRAP